jgi:hypothetical protein
MIAAALGALVLPKAFDGSSSYSAESGFSPTDITYSFGFTVIGTEPGIRTIPDLLPHATALTVTWAFLNFLSRLRSSCIIAAGGEIICAFGGFEDVGAGVERPHQAGEGSLGELAASGPVPAIQTRTRPRRTIS